VRMHACMALAWVLHDIPAWLHGTHARTHARTHTAALVVGGYVAAATCVWREGESAWTPISEVEQLKHLLQHAPPARPAVAAVVTASRAAVVTASASASGAAGAQAAGEGAAQPSGCGVRRVETLTRAADARG
jgi:hypothetical protein